MGKNSKIGGQAVLEGVMMRGVDISAIAVRTQKGEIAVDVQKIAQTQSKIRKAPLIRGVINFVSMLKVGMTSLNKSIELGGYEEEEPGRFEKWLSKKTGKSATDIVSFIALMIGGALAIGLFFVLPQLFISWISAGRAWTSIALNLWEGTIRLIVFLGYLIAVTALKDMRRFFAYHGAEHKVINCYEKGDLLTVENARNCTTRHPRCGTSFLLVVMVVSILVFSLLGRPDALWLRIGLRLALLPVVAAVSYEVLMLLARRDNWLTKALRWPGLLLQGLTTRVPDDEMLEVSIAAFAACMNEEERAELLPKEEPIECQPEPVDAETGA